MSRPRDEIVYELLTTDLSHHQLKLLAELLASRSERDEWRDERDAKRDARELAADRARKYRAKNKDKSGMAGQQDADGASRSKRDVCVTESVTPPLILSSLPLEKRTFEEVRQQEKKEVARARRKSAVPLPDDWQPKPSHYEAAQRLGRPSSFVDEKATDMRLWAQSNDARKVDWDATLHGFLRRHAKQNGPQHGPAKNVGNSALAAIRAIKARVAENSDDSRPDRIALIGVSKG